MHSQQDKKMTICDQAFWYSKKYLKFNVHMMLKALRCKPIYQASNQFFFRERELLAAFICHFRKKKCLSGYQITKVHLSYKISNNYKYSISKCLSHLVIFPISINKEIKSNDTKFKIWLKLIKFTCWTVRRFTILTPKQKIRASHPLNKILLIPSFTNGVT
jgi:hypothetical protein